VTATANTNILIGDDSAELIRGAEGTVSYLSGSGGDDTIIGAINGVAPGSTLEGGAGDDSLFSDGIGDIVLGGAGDDTLVNESGQASLIGGAGDDIFLPTDEQTTVYGGAGDDSVAFRDEANLAYGEDGDDTIIGGRGNDIFAGGAGDDYIKAFQTSTDANILFGNDGDDILVLSDTAADSGYGGMGDDSVYAGSGASAADQFLSGDKGNDTITYLGSGENVILDGDRSASGEPTLGTDAGNDVFSVTAAKGMFVLGGGGNDSLTGTLGAESEVYMGKGDDFFNVKSSGSSLFSGDLGNDSGTIVLAGDDTVWADGDGVFAGTDAVSGNDNLVLTGGVGGNVIYGDIPTDTVGGNDTLDVTAAGSGNLVAGGGGNDLLKSGGGNTLIGGAGNDIYELSAGDVIPFDSLGVNTYVAGSGASVSDVVTVQPGDSFTGGATFLVTGEAELIKTISNGGIIASDSKDLITIGTADQLTDLKAGDDTLQGVNLTDSGSVFGGAGNDNITFSGTDVAGLVDGGAGNDSISFTDKTATVTATVVGGAGVDTLAVAGIFAGSASSIDVFQVGTLAAGASLGAGDTGVELIIPGVGSGAAGEEATVSGGAGADTIGVGTSSSAGPVILFGNAGDDILRVGTGGNATLDGGAGNDTLISSEGQGYAGTSGTTAVQQGDFLVGGAGKDVFGFAGTNKLGFIGGLGATGSGVAYADSFISASGFGTDGTSFFNNYAVDTISGFVSGEDKLYFDTTFGYAAGGTLAAGGTSFYVVTGTDGLGEGQTFTGAGGSNSTAPSIVGRFGTGAGIGDVFGSNIDGSLALEEFGTNPANVFIYDKTAGALYYNTSAASSNLVAIFDPNTPIAATDFAFGDFSTGGTNTTLI
jgi:Ca2+-binding RTX toxin-like protein